MVRGILLHPAKPMAWINCGLDQRWPCGNAVARVPLRGDVRYGYKPGGNAVARVLLRRDVRYGYEPGGNADCLSGRS